MERDSGIMGLRVPAEIWERDFLTKIGPGPNNYLKEVINPKYLLDAYGEVLLTYPKEFFEGEDTAEYQFTRAGVRYINELVANGTVEKFGLSIQNDGTFEGEDTMGPNCQEDWDKTHQQFLDAMEDLEEIGDF